MLFILFCRYFGMFKMLLVLLVLETPLTHRDGFFVIYMSSGTGQDCHGVSFQMLWNLRIILNYNPPCNQANTTKTITNCSSN